MTVLLGTSQITWLQHLYDRQLKNQHATPIPSDIFGVLKAFGYVTGTAAAARITPEGSSVVVAWQLEAKVAAEASKKAKRKKGATDTCSQNCQKNTGQATFNFQQSAR